MSDSFYLMPSVGSCVRTERERELVWETILKLVDLIRVVRREGMLYLDNIADTEEDVFLRSCLRYITEADPTQRELREYVSIWFATADVTVFQRLKMAIIGDGLEQLILQRTPSAALRRLGVWLGAEYADRVEETLASINRVQRRKQAESLVPEFDQLLTLSDTQLRALIERSEDMELALALMGASDAVAKRLKTMVSPEKWRRITENYTPYPRACDVHSIQKRVLSFL